jgi:hypothetical protein
MKRQAPHEIQQPQLQPPQPAQAMQDLQPPRLQPLQPPQPLQPLAQPLAAQPLAPPLQPRWASCRSGPSGSASLSKTKNVPKLTSKISSSLRVKCGAVSRKFTSGTGARAPVAGPPPAIAMDTPTTPATGTAFFRCFRFVFSCFCFVRGIVETSHAYVVNLSPTAPRTVSLGRTSARPHRSLTRFCGN